MAITTTTRLGLNKIDLDDAGSRGNWAQYLNANMDNLEARIIRSGAGSPIGSIDPFNQGEYYWDTAAKLMYVANGNGVNDWQLVNLIQAAICGNQVANGTDGGGSASNTWTHRTLSEISDPSGIVSIVSNGFTIGAGTYLIRGSSAFHGAVGQARIRIWNVTDSSEAILGGNFGSASADVGFQATLEGIVTITASKNFRLEYRCENAVASTGLGKQDSMAAGVEIYASVSIVRIA